ncbi:glutathione S-transferase family protein [Gymnodinialimonas sp. 2305UL16-5]|uniref:glutathione S-transferase family protein n=1 Tax=Gymnodinialimonas mytili TaxID=3126503 RepID=UPI0030B0B7C5
MTDLILTTLDWVPDSPRGYVRDLLIRWALEEAYLPYRVETTPFDTPEERLPFQPFAQVPWLTDGDVTLGESAAILLYLGDRSEVLMPSDPQGRAKVMQWTFAAANSVEPAIFGTLFFGKDDPSSPGRNALEAFMKRRLERLDAVLAERDWCADQFSVADIFMTNALRLLDGHDILDRHPACRAYVERATARRAFQKAYSDQIAHFEAADAVRTKTAS